MLRRTLLAAVVSAGLIALPQLAGATAPAALPGDAVLRVGARGAQVRILQSDLALLQDPPGPVDGIFGPRTRAAVREFQGYVGLAPDGVVGAATWGGIHRYLNGDFHSTSGSLATAGAAYGNVGAPVVQLQRALLAQGEHPGPVNGVYDAATRSALYAFEAAHGLHHSAVVGSALARSLGSAQGAGASAASSTQGATSGARGSGSSASPAGSRSASGSGSGTIDGRSVLHVLHLTATAYGPSLQDNYPYGPVDYFGRPLVAGDVAVDPNVIPLDTWLWVTGYSSPFLPAGGFLAHAVDEGDAIKGMRIDLYMDQSVSSVSSFGIQPVKVYVLGN